MKLSYKINERTQIMFLPLTFEFDFKSIYSKTKSNNAKLDY